MVFYFPFQAKYKLEISHPLYKTPKENVTLLPKVTFTVMQFARPDEVNWTSIMRRMNNRHANIMMTCLALLIGLSACSPSTQRVPTQTFVSSTPSETVTFAPSPIPATFTPSPIPAAPTATAFVCTGDVGSVQQDVVSITNPPQGFLIYLPPCYENSGDVRFPVLYLLHGQTYNDDQWVRLGVPLIADQLISSGEFPPFIIVFPDDHYWNTPPGAGFGDRFINDLIPYVDKNYRTLPDREHRSLGGLSRGGGWTIELGFSHPELFGALGLHSPAIKVQDGPYLEKMIRSVPEKDRPLLWIDIGDADAELARVLSLEEKLSSNNYIHEFHRYSGAHTENYWGLHAEEYLRWYAQKWLEAPASR
jgi:enterochelin esterase-like enzyme